MKIFIKYLSGKVFSLDVESSITIKELKNKIEEKENLLPKFQILIFSGQECEDDKTLSYYSISNDSTIVLINENLIHQEE